MTEKDMEMLCKSLLKEWCEALLRLQIKDTGNPRLDGAILCPACGKIHGRCFEAMYPFLYMAEEEGDRKWVEAAEALFRWASHTVSMKDGSYLNDIDTEWKGTTVFNTIQLAECLLFHGSLLSQETKNSWKDRLEQAAGFLSRFDALKDNNINYPISNALALYECGMVLADKRYWKKAGELAAMAQDRMTENGLLFGEGVPQDKKSGRGCFPVDIGYNVEETLPSLALYGQLSGDAGALAAAEKGLAGHLSFMAGDGAWDNSFGTRNYKWTYWGSRTSDGCALGYLLLADRHPEFSLAAGKNLRLLRACTDKGLLAGGPHYRGAEQAACVHHTFTHAKVLAGILDRKLCRTEAAGSVLPRMENQGIRSYPEVDTWILTKGRMTATVTAYDWEYLPEGHVSGGTLSFLYHERAGTLLCAGMSHYARKEPNNMQVPFHVRHQCLALRIEAEQDGALYSSIYEDQVRVTVRERENGIDVTACGGLKDARHQKPSRKKMDYCLWYRLEADRLTVQAEFTDGVLICPVVSQSGEPVSVEEGGLAVRIEKEQAAVIVRSATSLYLPYKMERIFNLVPGLQALRMEIPPECGKAEVQLVIC